MKTTSVAATLQRRASKVAIVGRWGGGGEEFYSWETMINLTAANLYVF